MSGLRFYSSPWPAKVWGSGSQQKSLFVTILRPETFAEYPCHHPFR
ncbi:hypothetical protein CLV76_14117 [Marivita geojedonensis]|nr:hypothetical protein CLV76_14117 [Marivita geojedonensis]